jgi:hypothetical protein
MEASRDTDTGRMGDSEDGLSSWCLSFLCAVLSEETTGKRLQQTLFFHSWPTKTASAFLQARHK